MFDTAENTGHAGTPSLVGDRSRETRQRLLDAAGEVFAEHGFRDATVRDICRRAGANVAAINYHFGGKDRLYVDVLRYVDERSLETAPISQAVLAGLTPEMKLAGFVRHFIRRVFDRDRPAWHERLMAREMIEPTHALDELVDRNIRPRALLLQAIVREMLGPEATVREVQRGAASVVGQCLFYWHCRPMIGRLMPEIGFDPSEVESLAGHITAFSLHALRGMAAADQRGNGAGSGGSA